MQHDPQKNPAIHLRILAAAVLIAAAGAKGAEATPAIELSNGRQPISSLFVGGHLAAGITGGEPEEEYRFELRNADNVLIAAAETEANLAGNVPAVLLWTHTGVVGCNLGAVVDPTLYRFASFGDAEDALAGTSLQLLALDSADLVVATRTVSVVAAPQEVPYFSDAAGCFRSHYPSDEDVYVSFFHPARAVASRAIYLVSQPAGPIPIGDPIADARSSKPPQFFTVPPTGDPVTVKVWSLASTSPGTFALVVRSGEGEAAPIRYVLEGDVIIEAFGGTSTTGLNIGVNGCNCIVPPG